MEGVSTATRPGPSWSARSGRWREGVGCRTFVCRRPARSL